LQNQAKEQVVSSYRTLVRGLPVLALAAAQACAPAGVPEMAPPPVDLPADGSLPLKFAAQPTAPGIRAMDLMSRLYVIADDSMMGRQAGHRGNQMATEYIAAEFRRMGLEPAGENGTFFQTIPLVVKGIEPGASLSVDGQPLALWDQVSPLPPVSGLFPFGAELRASNTPVVFGGTIGGEMITDAQAAGKLVVLLPPAGPNGQPNGRWWPAYPRDRFPAAAGVAVAATEISPPAIRTYGQSQSSELQEPGSEAASTGPAGMSITRAAAERLLGAPLDGMRPGTAGRTVTGGFRFGSRPADAPARNVVAILRGSDPAVNGQYVGISAHNDHEGIAAQAVDHDSAIAYNTVMRPQGANDQPRAPNAEQAARIRALRDSLSADGTRRDSIFNGADDDGSGTVALLEIAEAFAGAGSRPRRSILFISHTAEEAGLLGSQWYSDHPTVPRDSIVTVLNMDMVGHGRASEVAGGGPYSIQMIGSRRLSTELGDLIDALNARRPTPMQIDYSWDAAGHPANRYCRSDHFMYARHGIPITYFSLGYHPHYHMVTDEPQYIDYEHSARVASFLHDIAAEVANRPARLVVDGPRQDPNAPCRQ
jgi:Peptidase family M28